MAVGGNFVGTYFYNFYRIGPNGQEVYKENKHKSDQMAGPVLFHDKYLFGSYTTNMKAEVHNGELVLVDPANKDFDKAWVEDVAGDKTPVGNLYVDGDTIYTASNFTVAAVDGTTGKKIWDYQQISSFHYGPGVLSTGGGLVFAGEHKGQVSALDARTGKSLWHFNTGDLITSSPISYAVDGQQYIAISSGTNIFAFALP